LPAALFAPDGRLLNILPGNALQWPMDVGPWERFACRDAGRDLSRAEWHDILPNRACRSIC
jgi:hypothetical protein